MKLPASVDASKVTGRWSAHSDEALHYLAAIIESSDDVIISKDLNGIITTWNPAAEKVFGYTADEIIGKSVLTIIPPELQHEEPEILRKLRAGERIDHFETRRRRKDGSLLEVSLTISPIRDGSGKIVGASKILRDITQRKLSEAALIRSEKAAATGRLAAAIAHEVNNPLEAVLNLAYLLANHPSLDPEARHYAELLTAEASRASKITRQTLAFYRTASAPEEFDLSEVLASLLEVHRSKLRRRNIELVSDFANSVVMWGFASEIRQVVVNLLLNAIDAVDQGGKIVLRMREHCNGEVAITVSDNGKGIPREFKSKIYQPFFSTKSAKGTGLGLWVSAGIISKHGGRVQMRSCTDPQRSGTVFRVLLPKRPQSLEAANGQEKRVGVGHEP